MSIFDVTYKDYVSEYLPPDKREPVTQAYFTALLSALQTLHNDTYLNFKPFVEDLSKQNAQRILFESILNSTFGVTSAPLIYIDNTGNDITPLILFNEGEGLVPTYFFNEGEPGGPVYLRNEGEITNNKTFIVFVPLAVYTAVGEPQIEKEVDRLKILGTNYTIQTY